MAGNIGFMVATTSIVVLMPLIFEIMREGQVCILVFCIGYNNCRGNKIISYIILTSKLYRAYPNTNNTLVQMIETDKLHVKELRQQGYSDNQLRELGFPAVALGQAPAVLKSS